MDYLNKLGKEKRCKRRKRKYEEETKTMQNGQLCCPTRVPKTDLGILGLAFQKHTDLPLAAVITVQSPKLSELQRKEHGMGRRL